MKESVKTLVSLVPIVVLVALLTGLNAADLLFFKKNRIL